MDIRSGINQLKWSALGIALSLSSLLLPPYGGFGHRTGRVTRVRSVLPVRSILTVSMRLPALLGTN